MQMYEKKLTIKQYSPQFYLSPPSPPARAPHKSRGFRRSAGERSVMLELQCAHGGGKPSCLGIARTERAAVQITGGIGVAAARGIHYLTRRVRRYLVETAIGIYQRTLASQRNHNLHHAPPRHAPERRADSPGRRWICCLSARDTPPPRARNRRQGATRDDICRRQDRSRPQR